MPHINGGQLADNRKISIICEQKVVRKGNLFVIEGIFMKYDKKAAIDIIVNAAIKYKEYLQDKIFLIIYQENAITKTVQVEFRDNHFLHLTGVTTQLSAKRFYEKCLNKKLALNDIELDKNGKAHQKLMVLPYLHELLYNNCMIGNFINSGICIRADYFVGNTKAILSVGFRYGKKVDFPVTLYKEDVRKLSQPTNKVLAIFVRDYRLKNYAECTHLSKGQEIDKLPISKEIKELIQIKNEV